MKSNYQKRMQEQENGQVQDGQGEQEGRADSTATYSYQIGADPFVASFTCTLPNDTELTEKHRFGKQPQTCQICGSSGDFETYNVLEMFMGTKEPFRYFACPVCECLQIETIPDNLGDYYASSYYSYALPDVSPPSPDVLPIEESVLDVGCGSGAFLCELAQQGYKHLFGCDPFIEKDLHYPNGVTIYKRSTHEMEGQYDRIYLNDSFEHVTDPLPTLQKVRDLLRPGGLCIIKAPLFPNHVFKAYESFWYEIDAPRHLYIPSQKSIAYLASQCGMVVASCVQVGNALAYPVSRMYQMGVPYFIDRANSATGLFTPQQLQDMATLNIISLMTNNAEHATFTLCHGPGPRIDSADTLQRILDLNGTMDMALEHLVGAAEGGTLQQNAYLLEDLLLANAGIRMALSGEGAPDMAQDPDPSQA